MRVITGTARGRRLKEPEGMDIRPTTDQVKESIFNIIQFDIEGREALDLFAGTGQLGIEALSRGARSCVFVDQSPAAVAIIKRNLETTGLAASARVVAGESLGFLRSGGKYDLIFLDPPYDTALLDRALHIILEFDILKDNGIIVCESKAEKTLPELAAPYTGRREYKYGKIKLTVFTREAGV